MIRTHLFTEILCAPLINMNLAIKDVRMARHIGLLSLPDEVLELVAPMTHDDKTWAMAAMTCKKLWKMQIPACPLLKSWKSEAPQMHSLSVYSLAAGADSILLNVKLFATDNNCSSQPDAHHGY